MDSPSQPQTATRIWSGFSKLSSDISTLNTSSYLLFAPAEWEKGMLGGGGGRTECVFVFFPGRQEEPLDIQWAISWLCFHCNYAFNCLSVWPNDRDDNDFQTSYINW